MKKVKLSIIVPVLNEQENITELLKQIKQAKITNEYEVIFVDDGSTDSTAEIIKKIAKKDKKIKMISFTRNFGQQSAIATGLLHASGEHIAIMDADLQDSPLELKKMYQKALKGIDIVYAVRKTRQEKQLKQTFYKLFYSLYSYLSDYPIHQNSGDFSVMHKKVVHQINAMPENIKFLRGIRSWLGYKSTPHPVDRPPRHAGIPKYSFSKLMNLGLSGITSMSIKPLRLATALGGLICIFSFSVGIVYLLIRIFTDVGNRVPGFTTLIIFIALFSGLQIFIMGIIGEYIATIFLEIKNRPNYIIKELVNIKPTNEKSL